MPRILLDKVYILILWSNKEEKEEGGKGENKFKFVHYQAGHSFTWKHSWLRGSVKCLQQGHMELSGHSVWSGGRWAMYLPAFLLTIVQRSLHGALTSARLSVQLLKKPRLLWSSRTQMSEVLHLPLPQSLPLLKTVNISRIKMWHYNGGRFTITAQNRQNLKKKIEKSADRE